MKPSEFIHPEDAAALRQLESVPGFPALVKKFYAIGVEKMVYGNNMATNIRLSETQLPEYYRLLAPICRKLGIAEPEFYLQMNPMPNAWTFGDTRIFITMTSGLVELLSEDELIAVIGHECGHILCRHVLYHNMANMLLNSADAFGMLGMLSAPLKLAFYYWMRKSELSCDRAGALVTDPDTVARTMARLAGGPKALTGNIDMEEWARQADEYEKIRTDGLWNKTLQAYSVMDTDHPFAAVRVREILKWAKTPQYLNLKANMESGAPGEGCCPGCGQPADPSWMFCRYCGRKLK